MKQNITIDQLNELSEEGKEKLKEWWKPEYGDWFCEPWGKIIRKRERLYVDTMGYDLVDPTIATTWVPPRALPLLTIGQMIEFLDEQGGKDVEYGFDPAEVYNYKGGYVLIQWFDAKDHDLELADVLWKACKEILQKEHNGIH